MTESVHPLNYRQMWEDFGESKSDRYLDYKFTPTHRVGLTNFLRERLIYLFLDPNENDIVLDAGCASGRQLMQLAPRIKKGYGTDIAQSFIERAESASKMAGADNLIFRTSNIENLPFDDDYFDKIICAEVLEHVADKDVALKELLRVLKKDGVLVVTVPNMNADGTIWGRILRMLGFRKFRPLEQFSEKAISNHGDAHVREYSKDGFMDWFLKNDLKIEDLKSVSFIDGPFIDFLIKFPLHVGFARKLIIKLEQTFTNLNLFFGRHLAVRARKK